MAVAEIILEGLSPGGGGVKYFPTEGFLATTTTVTTTTAPDNSDQLIRIEPFLRRYDQPRHLGWSAERTGKLRTEQRRQADRRKAPE